MADADAVPAEFDDLGIVEMNAVGEPVRALSQLQRSRYSTGVQANLLRQNSASALVSTRWVWSRQS